MVAAVVGGGPSTVSESNDESALVEYETTPARTPESKMRKANDA
jgi:hypothetical protein